MTIFAIDIDGVARPDRKPNDYKVDPDCVRRINQALRHHDAQVVITSNWRLAFRIEFFNTLFEGRVIAVTPDPDDSREENRWHEIQSVLPDRAQPFPLIILDDRADLFPAQLPYLHLCNPDTGFSDADLQHLTGGAIPPLFPIHRNEPERTRTMSEQASQDNDNLDEIVTVEISLPRRELNRLTHATIQSDYESAVRWACLESIKKTRTMRDFVEKAPLKTDPMD